MVQATLEQGMALRNAGLDSVERHNASWVGVAREIAVEICRREGDVDTDRIQAVWPRPSWVHPNSLGAVLRPPQFRRVRRPNGEPQMIQSTRPSTRARWIGLWIEGRK